MSEVVIWIVAGASAVLLVAGGFVLAVARLRSRFAATRKAADSTQSMLYNVAADPFGELKVIADQLARLRRRLDQVPGGSASASMPPLPAPASFTDPPEPTPGKAVTAELEADLELFKRDAYGKTRRIEELEAEKQRLGEKIVHLEEQLERAQRTVAPPPPRPPAEAQGSSEDLVGLIDTLQQETDALRQQINERDRRIRTLTKGDATGITHELERVRRELRTRNDEVQSLRDSLGRAERAATQAKTRAGQLEHEKETVAARALDSAAELRRAQERIRDLERQIASRAPEPRAGAPWPSQAPTTSPGGRPDLTPSRPVPRLTPPPQPRLTPPAGLRSMPHAKQPPPAPSPFDRSDAVRTVKTPFDHPDLAVTQKSGPPITTPPGARRPPPPPSRQTGSYSRAANPGRKRRTTGSIFPLPQSKEDDE